MSTFLWITGRAAAGKSTVIAECVTRLQTDRAPSPMVLSDEELLLRLKAKDVEHRHHFHPDGGPQFAFCDGYLFDEGLRHINAALRKAMSSGAPNLVLVELARGIAGAVVDVSYQRALALIDPRIWAHSLVFRLEVDHATQIARNRARAIERGRATPENVMHRMYACDDPESLTAAGIPVRTIPQDHSPGKAAAIIIDALKDTPLARMGVERVASHADRTVDPSLIAANPADLGDAMHETLRALALTASSIPTRQSRRAEWE